MGSAFTIELSSRALVSRDDLRSGGRKNNHVRRLRWEHIFKRYVGIRRGYLDGSRYQHPAPAPHCYSNGLRFCQAERGALRGIRRSKLPGRYLAVGWTNFQVHTGRTRASASGGDRADVVPGSEWPSRLFWWVRRTVLSTNDVAMERFRLDAIVPNDGSVCSQFRGSCHQ